MAAARFRQYSNNVLVDNPVLTTSPSTFSYSVNPQATVANAQLQFQAGGTAGVASIQCGLLLKVVAVGGLTGADALAYADPDGDGLDNITEYAFNLNPSTNDAHNLSESVSASGLPVSHVDPSNGYETFSVEYVRKNSDIINYIPEFADSLSDGWIQLLIANLLLMIQTPRETLHTILNQRAQTPLVLVVFGYYLIHKKKGNEYAEKYISNLMHLLFGFVVVSTGICEPKKNHNILMIIVDDLRT